MQTVVSNDGTRIAFTKSGHGPAVILVDGALCYRSSGPMGALSKQLEQHFTVYVYDRRGRGESGDTKPYAIKREVEDIEALVNDAGGSAFLCGESSGGALALEAAAAGLPIKKLAIFEAPFFVDNSHPPLPGDYLNRLNDLIAAGHRDNAVRLFMKTVGVPAPFIFLMRFMPAWPKLRSVAHTLPYDFDITLDNQKGKPLSLTRWASVKMPALVCVGGRSPSWMQQSMRSLAEVLPNASLRSLEGQTHMVKATSLGPALAEFFAA